MFMLTAVLCAHIPLAEAQSSGTASISIEQNSTLELLGKWTLLMPTEEQRYGGGESSRVQDLPAGQYTFYVEEPKGSNAKLRVYADGESKAKIYERPQTTFALAEGQHIRITVHYSFVRLGTVAVHSDPPGMMFELHGPNRFQMNGVTPAMIEDAPEGQYKAEFLPLEGCATPATLSNLLLPGERISFSVKVACKEADNMRNRLTDKDETYVTVPINNKNVVLQDVPQNTWFAPYVYTAAKYNILTGYSNVRGEPTGMFGPGNNVTVSELAKIAHKLTGTNEKEITLPSHNPQAAGTWFEKFVASAEQRGWVIFMDPSMDLSRAATRGEVVVTLLQALDVPVRWQKGTVFADVSVRTPFSAAIETAAADGLVTGLPGDNPLPSFGPGQPINRAELSKIISLAIELYRSE